LWLSLDDPGPPFARGTALELPFLFFVNPGDWHNLFCGPTTSLLPTFSIGNHSWFPRSLKKSFLFFSLPSEIGFCNSCARLPSLPRSDPRTGWQRSRVNSAYAEHGFAFVTKDRVPKAFLIPPPSFFIFGRLVKFSFFLANNTQRNSLNESYTDCGIPKLLLFFPLDPGRRHIIRRTPPPRVKDAIL